MIAFVLTTGTTVVTKNDFDSISTPGLAVEAGRAQYPLPPLQQAAHHRLQLGRLPQVRRAQDHEPPPTQRGEFYLKAKSPSSLLRLKFPSPQEHPTSNRWEEIGVWNSEKGGKVDIKDIVWPGEALKPPEGVPERGFLTVTFLEV